MLGQPALQAKHLSALDIATPDTQPAEAAGNAADITGCPLWTSGTLELPVILTCQSDSPVGRHPLRIIDFR